MNAGTELCVSAAEGPAEGKGVQGYRQGAVGPIACSITPPRPAGWRISGGRPN